MHREKEIIQWAEEKGIYASSTLLDQFKVMKEEVDEAYTEAVRLIQLRELGYDSKIVEADLVMELGDIGVTYVNVCKMAGMNPKNCMERAWQKIKTRTGKMFKGKFVKDADLKTDSLDENGAVITRGVLS